MRGNPGNSKSAPQSKVGWSMGGGGTPSDTGSPINPGTKRLRRPDSRPSGGFTPHAVLTRGAEERYQKLSGHAIVLWFPVHWTPRFCGTLLTLNPEVPCATSNACSHLHSF